MSVDLTGSHQAERVIVINRLTLADGTLVTLAPGSEVALAADAQVKIWDGTDTALVDHDTKALYGIDGPHAMIHDGKAFLTSETQTGIAAAAELRYSLAVGSQEAHFTFAVNASLATKIQLYEGTTYSDAGTALSEINLNRTSARTATVAVTRNRTVNVLGTKLLEISIPGGEVFRGSVGGGSDRSVEWYLAENEDYLLVLTNIHATDPSDISTELDWYEPEAP
jgi:hypothetical protein